MTLDELIRELQDESAALCDETGISAREIKVKLADAPESELTVLSIYHDRKDAIWLDLKADPTEKETTMSGFLPSRSEGHTKAVRALSRTARLRIEHDQLQKDFDELKKQVAKDQKVLEMLRKWKERVREGVARSRRRRDR
jgi:hypothetical protein